MFCIWSGSSTQGRILLANDSKARSSKLEHWHTSYNGQSRRLKRVKASRNWDFVWFGVKPPRLLASELTGVMRRFIGVFSAKQKFIQSTSWVSRQISNASYNGLLKQRTNLFQTPPWCSAASGLKLFCFLYVRVLKFASSTLHPNWGDMPIDRFLQRQSLSHCLTRWHSTTCDESLDSNHTDRYLHPSTALSHQVRHESWIKWTRSPFFSQMSNVSKRRKV